jgi:hypothetical protein
MDPCFFLFVGPLFTGFLRKLFQHSAQYQQLDGSPEL